ncbi:hypothetical protein HPB47_013724 [Ixodes persulcatus]|uniref:Uncharacterized protein n=1 Tax=Ixodes persulcatus TaxID=34615 RepID=A0AC60QXS6_IXOPE|nr:hypothetical protein HPB47_013724 [Ixodes persulcatus]
MEASKRRPTYQVIDGDKVSIQILPDIYRQALKFVPEEGDIVQTTFPRCGSHWVQQIVQLILNKGESAKTFAELARRAPFIEFSGELSKSSPRLIRTHLPLGKIQFNDKAKYIYVARNPWDCCLSMFHFLRELPGLNFEDGLFDDCVDSFIEGTTGGGDWFQHVLSGYKLKDQPNVFFVTYEELKAKTTDVVLRLGFFLGEEYGLMLQKDRQVLQSVLEKCSFSYMKSFMKTNTNEIMQLFVNNPSVETQSDKPVEVNIVRHGNVGDWKGHFTDENIEKIRAKIEDTFRGVDVMSLWKDV